VCTTTRRRCGLVDVSPMITKRSSSVECSGSAMVKDSGSPNTVVASSKETPCRSTFCPAFSSSHSKVSPICALHKARLQLPAGSRHLVHLEHLIAVVVDVLNGGLAGLRRVNGLLVGGDRVGAPIGSPKRC